MKPSSLLAAVALTFSLLRGAPAEATPAPAPAALGVAQSPEDPVPGIVEQIMQAVGLSDRFVVVPSHEILSAAAVTIDGRRCIVYNPEFVRIANSAAQTPWAGTSILAHEIGHHLHGHTLSTDAHDQAASFRNELEADVFSGFALRRLGATAEEAVVALTLLASEEESSTHPPRSSRIAAVAEGWNDGGTGVAYAPSVSSPPPATSPAEAGAATEPEAEPAPLRWRLNPAAIAGQLTFDVAPDRVLYLTKKLHLVDDTPDGARVMGSLERTRSRRYPYRLVQADGQSTLFVTPAGTIVTAKGHRVGQLKLI